MSNIVKIPLDKGKFAIIDSGDLSLISGYKWYARKAKNGVYYATSTMYKNVHMHRLLMGLTDPKVFVDHKNHDGLDNTRDNLRIATHTQNNCNKRSYNDVSSKYKGVYWNKERGKWTSQVRKPGEKKKHIGHFDSEIEAAKAYNKAAINAHGEFASLNEIPL